MVFSERIKRLKRETTTPEALTAICILQEYFEYLVGAGLAHEVPMHDVERLPDPTQKLADEANIPYKEFVKIASSNEYQLFVTLFNYSNSPNNGLHYCTHDELAHTVWGEDLPDDIEGSVNKLVQRTRERMKKASVPFTIKSKKGMGYYLLNT